MAVWSAGVMVIFRSGRHRPSPCPGSHRGHLPRRHWHNLHTELLQSFRQTRARRTSARTYRNKFLRCSWCPFHALDHRRMVVVNVLEARRTHCLIPLLRRQLLRAPLTTRLEHFKLRNRMDDALNPLLALRTIQVKLRGVVLGLKRCMEVQLRRTVRTAFVEGSHR